MTTTAAPSRTRLVCSVAVAGVRFEMARAADMAMRSVPEPPVPMLQPPFEPLDQHAGDAPGTPVRTLFAHVEPLVSHARNWLMSRVKPRMVFELLPLPPA